jgi:hypothetical protein
MTLSLQDKITPLELRSSRKPLRSLFGGNHDRLFSRLFFRGVTQTNDRSTAVLVDEPTSLKLPSLQSPQRAPFRNPEKARRCKQAIIVTGELHVLLLRADKLQRREVNRVQCPHSNGKWLQRAFEHGPNYFNHRDAADQVARRITVRALQAARVDAVPDFALQEPAGHQLLVP